MSPAIYVLIFIQVATGAPPTSRREVCHNVFGLDSLYKCADQGPSEAGDDTMRSTPLSHTLLMAGLLVAGLVTLALLAWALYSYLSQVTNIYIFHRNYHNLSLSRSASCGSRSPAGLGDKDTRSYNTCP